jgi:hypothetical protein
MGGIKMKGWVRADKVKKYELVSDGKLYDSIMETSFKRARAYFADNWVGCFTITCEGEHKNVRLSL